MFALHLNTLDFLIRILFNQFISKTKEAELIGKIVNF